MQNTQTDNTETAMKRILDILDEEKVTASEGLAILITIVVGSFKRMHEKGVLKNTFTIDKLCLALKQSYEIGFNNESSNAT